MGVIGGLGSGRGWLKYQFLISPDELRQVLSDSGGVLMVTNSRVPVSYQSTSISDYIIDYAEQFASPDDTDSTIGLHISLLSRATQYSWNPVPVRRKKRDEGFKLIDLAEPVIHFAAVHAMWGGDGRLYFCFDDPRAAWVGIEMQFPRVVSLSADGHERLYETGHHKNAQLFRDVQRSIRAITSPAIFTTPSGKRRTRLRISPTAASKLRAHPSLVRQGLHIL